MTSVLGKYKKLGAEADERAMPDSTTTSTTIMVEYAVGQDILLKQKDGRYYFGTVVQVDQVHEQCLVKFDDNTKVWSCFKDLMKLSMSEQEDLLMCVICKKSAPKSKKEIIVCEHCGRGYHQRCHQPCIPTDFKEDWMCKRCIEQKKTKKKHKSVYYKALPYDLGSLTWDDKHQCNREEVYCYCGKIGEWMRKMVQCARCRQWFHENCIDCLKYPLYCGDRFYIFLCTNCNDGKEFLRRLELEWVDLVHMLLFNLTILNTRKYFDLDSVIVPYLDDNWLALQLPPKILNSKLDRRENILSVLTSNRNRFKCGKELKKRATIWGLRVRLPPPAPPIQLSKGLVTEENLRQKWLGNKRLQLLPAVCQQQGMMRLSSDTMSGAAYINENQNSETDSAESGAELEENAFLIDENYVGAVKKSVQLPKLSLKAKKRLLSYSGRKRELLLRRQKRKDTRELPRRATRLSLDGSGTTNKRTRGETPLTPPTSLSAPPTPPTSGSSSNVPSELSLDYNEHASSFILSLKKEKQRLINDDLHTPCDTSGDETSSKSTLDLIIPPPKDFEGKNNPFLAFAPHKDEQQQQQQQLHSSELRKNKKRSLQKDITLPLPLTAVIPAAAAGRPTKRQLSEKDICIGPNGEVKRRRLRRSKNGGANNATNSSNSNAYATTTASKTATVLPARVDNEWNRCLPNIEATSNLISDCVDYALNGRRLRQRPDGSTGVGVGNNDKNKKPPTPKSSPVKTEPDINMDDLKSSVHSYFGAATRILDGERFAVRAKRFGPTGKLEYLMEWEGVSNGHHALNQ